MFLQTPAENPTVQPETIFSIGNFPVTNAMITASLVTVVFLIIALIAKKVVKKNTLANYKQFLKLLLKVFVIY